MEVAFRLRRQPDRSSPPYWQTFHLTLDGCTVLDALNRIQWELDGTLAFRRNCRNVICGSCGMEINGKPSLACQVSVASVVGNGVIEIKPMGNFPVIKDLVVDMTSFWQDLQRVDPYVVSVTSRQTPDQRSVVAKAAGCILCSNCYSACNVKTVNPQFVGPHALAKAQRLLADNRDNKTIDRLQKYHHNDFVWGCTRCWQCNEVCPVGVQPLDRISEIKAVVLNNKRTHRTTAVKHRQVLISLVKRWGWLDEAQFVLGVVNILSVIPLGMRLILCSKFPYPWQFVPSKGREQIKAIIDLLLSDNWRESPALLPSHSRNRHGY